MGAGHGAYYIPCAVTSWEDILFNDELLGYAPDAWTLCLGTPALRKPCMVNRR